jgi:hypothetical protein
MQSWRAHENVLVTDTDYVIGIGALRDLGAAGYTVHSTSVAPDALGARSSYLNGSHAQCPPYEQREQFAEWLESHTRRLGVSLIVPGSDRFLIAIRPHFEKYARLIPAPDAETLYSVNNKYLLFRRFAGADDPSLREHLPPHALIDDTAVPPDADPLFRSLGGPLYIKASATSSPNNTPDSVFRCDDPASATAALAALRSSYRNALVQGFVRGAGVGVFLLIWDGQVLARFMHQRLHENPHTGGVSTFRKSIWQPEIFADAEKRLQFLSWRGVAMLEYKWDPASGQFYLLEINGRLWGSLHLALHSGVLFPRLLADAHFGRVAADPAPIRVGVRCRYTFPLEMRYLRSLLLDPDVPMPRKLSAILEFLWLFANPRVKSDLLYPRDRRLYWLEFLRWVSEFAGRRGIALHLGGG